MTTSRVLEGYAATFNSPTVITFEKGIKGSFNEQIAPGAFAFALSKPEGQCVFLREHDWGLLLGRRGKNLALIEDEKGLRFRVELPETTLGDETLELVDKQILRGMSFRFGIAKESWYEPDAKRGKESGRPLRVIEAVSALYDISACTFPAYDAPTVTVGRGEARPLRPEVLELMDRLARLRTDAGNLASPKPRKLGRRILPPDFAKKLPSVVRRGCVHVLKDALNVPA